jgi:antitoxin component of RelBE/YafQ-DinJ toxin-antitoxin module
MIKGKYITTSIYIGGDRLDIWRTAQAHAKKHGLSLSEVITGLLRHWNRQQAMLPYDEIYKAARARAQQMTAAEAMASIKELEAMEADLQQRADAAVAELTRRGVPTP